MNKIFSNWSLMRTFRLAIGLLIIAQGVWSNNVSAGVLGGLFAFMAIANVGCCGANGCRAPRQPGRTDKATQDVIYEEVK